MAKTSEFMNKDVECFELKINIYSVKTDKDRLQKSSWFLLQTF